MHNAAPVAPAPPVPLVHLPVYNRPRAPDGSQLTREEEDDTRTWPRKMVVGMPTVKRHAVSYLRDTMKLIVDRLPENKWKEVVIVVYPAELEDTEWPHQVCAYVLCVRAVNDETVYAFLPVL